MIFSQMRHLFYSLVILLGSAWVNVSYADENISAASAIPAESAGAHIRFEHQTYSFGDSYSKGSFWNDETVSKTNVLFDKNQSLNGKINQYDTTISYPLNMGSKINVDIGVNIRHLEVDLSSPTANTQHMSTTVPMLYATAFFDLPFEGLSASVEGRHTQFDDIQAYEYKAQFNYKWENGLGLQGGWQHQELNIESGSDFSAQFEVDGPFLDLNYNF